MRNFMATNTNDIKEDRARCCRAHKEICCFKKCSYCCAVLWTFYSLPRGTEVSKHKFGLPRRAKQSCSVFYFTAFMTFLSLNPVICPLVSWASYPTTTVLIKTNQILPGSLLQEEAPEMPLWSTTGKGSVFYRTLRRNNPHSEHLCKGCFCFQC